MPHAHRFGFAFLVPFLAFGGMALGLNACSNGDDYQPISGLDLDKKAELTIGIPYETDKALNDIADLFSKRYQNVTISLQYVETEDAGYKLFENGSLDILLMRDKFYSADEESKTTSDDFYYNFADDADIDFGDVSTDIFNNYIHDRDDGAGGNVTYMYSVPLGGETRGVFVNVSYLTSLGLSVPKDYEELCAVCESLLSKGIVPIQGSAATFPFGLALAESANLIAKNPENYQKMKNAEAGTSEIFRDVFGRLYEMATKRYFDYTAVQDTGFFASSAVNSQVQSFLGLSVDKETYEVTKPENNIGNAAFFPYVSSITQQISLLIDRYDLNTDFKFILSPTNEKGTDSKAYLTPSYGIAAYKHSDNLIWSKEFVNFIFHKANNVRYAEGSGLVPCVKGAINYLMDKFGIDETDCTLSGEILFSTSYNGYRPIATTVTSICKSNAKKYMADLNKDEGGNPTYMTDETGDYLLMNGKTKVYREYVGEEDDKEPGYAFCNLNYYLNEFENSIAKYRA